MNSKLDISNTDFDEFVFFYQNALTNIQINNVHIEIIYPKRQVSDINIRMVLPLAIAKKIVKGWNVFEEIEFPEETDEVLARTYTVIIVGKEHLSKFLSEKCAEFPTLNPVEFFIAQILFYPDLFPFRDFREYDLKSWTFSDEILEKEDWSWTWEWK